MQIFYYIPRGCAVFRLIFGGNFGRMTEDVGSAHASLEGRHAAGERSAKIAGKHITAAAL